MSRLDFSGIPSGCSNREAIVESFSWVLTLHEILRHEKAAFGGTGAILAMDMDHPIQIENLTIFCTTSKIKVLVQTAFEIAGLETLWGSGVPLHQVMCNTLIVKLRSNAILKIFFSSVSDGDLYQLTSVKGIRVPSPEILTASVLFEFAENPTTRGTFAIMQLYEIYRFECRITPGMQALIKNFIGRGYDSDLDRKLNELFETPIEECPRLTIEVVARSFRGMLMDGSNLEATDLDNFALGRDEITRLRNALHFSEVYESKVKLNRKVCRILFETFGGIYDTVGPEVYLLKSEENFLINRIDLRASDRFGDSIYPATIRQALGTDNTYANARQTEFGFEVEYKAEDGTSHTVEVHIDKDAVGNSSALPKDLGFSSALYGEAVPDVFAGVSERLMNDYRVYDLIAWTELLRLYPGIQTLCCGVIAKVYKSMLSSDKKIKLAMRSDALHDERILQDLDVSGLCDAFVGAGSNLKGTESDREITQLS